MSPGRSIHPLPRYALTREEAAESLGFSVDHFEKHVQGEVKLIRRGRKIVVPCSELQKWVEQNASHLFERGAR